MRSPQALSGAALDSNEPSTLTSLFMADEESVGAQFSGVFPKESDSALLRSAAEQQFPCQALDRSGLCLPYQGTELQN